MGLVVSEKKIFLVFPIVSLWHLSVAMETTILIQSAPKPNAINPPTQLWFTLNLIKIGLLASEIFFFEIVDGRRRRTTTTDSCLSYKLTCELKKLPYLAFCSQAIQGWQSTGQYEHYNNVHVPLLKLPIASSL